MPVPAPPPAFEAQVSPAKAGSEASPKPAKIRLALENKTANARLVVIYFPQGIRISNVGLADGTTAGTGSITVDDAPLDLAPQVSAKGLRFTAGDALLDGVFSQASGPYTAKLTIKIPKPLRAFTALSLDLKVKALFATRGCPLPFRLELTGAKKTTLNAKAPCKPRT